MADRFPGYDLSQMINHFQQRGDEFGLEFGNLSMLSNSRLALEASEYARDMGKHDGFHEAMFQAYFTDALDIGKWDVISRIAEHCDLDAEDMIKAVREGRYRERLAQVRQDAGKIGLTGVPTFIIEGQYKVVGAQPVGVFIDIFEKVNRG